MRCTLLSCFAKRARRGKLPIAASTAVCLQAWTRNLHQHRAPAAGRVSDPSTEVQTPARDKQRRVQPRCPGPTNSLPLHPRIGAAERRPHRCSAHQHGSDGGHGMGHLPQDSQTRHRHGAPVRAQRGMLAPAPRARVRTTRHARTCPPCPCSHDAARQHLQRCNRGVDGPGAGDDCAPVAGEGGTCCLRTSWRAS